MDRNAEDNADPGGEIDPRLLELLVCPLTKTRLEYDARTRELVSRAAGLAFPIKNGVPIMTVDSARRLDDDTRPHR